MGDSPHTQNVQISKVIGENEEHVFYFTEKKKKKHGLFGQPDSSQNKGECVGPSGQSSIDSAFGGNFPGAVTSSTAEGRCWEAGGSLRVQ